MFLRKPPFRTLTTQAVVSLLAPESFTEKSHPKVEQQWPEQLRHILKKIFCPEISRTNAEDVSGFLLEALDTFDDDGSEMCL